MRYHGTPLFLAVDQEGGRVSRLMKPFTQFPGNSAIGGDPRPVEKAVEFARITAREMSLTGLNMNLAPVVDVNSNPKNPVIGMRSFGEDPGRVSVLATHYMKGLQDEGIIASAKHFPGHGDTGTDSHYTLPVLNRSKKEMRTVELVPFEYLIDQGVASVMVEAEAPASGDDAVTFPETIVSGAFHVARRVDSPGQREDAKDLALSGAGQGIFIVDAGMADPTQHLARVGLGERQFFQPGSIALFVVVDPERAIVAHRGAPE